MTVNVSKAAINLREKLKSLSAPYIIGPPRLVGVEFSNLVENGGFTTDSDWTKSGIDGASNSISGGAATVVGNSYYYQAANLSLGNNYLIGGEIISTSTNSGDIRVGVTAPNDSLINLNNLPVGEHSGNFVASNSSVFISLKTNYSPGVTSDETVYDNIYLYEADPSDDAPWYRLPYGMKVKQGSTQRGMVMVDGVVLFADEYEQIEDNGQVWIKPDVAPGVSTRTGIWGYYG